MDSSSVLILYYSISLIITVLLVRGARDYLLKVIGLLFVITFVYFILSYLGIVSRSGYELGVIAIAFILIAVRTIKLKRITLFDGLTLAMFPIVTLAVLGSYLLHLNGWNEIRLFSVFILAITIIYLTIVYLRKGTLTQLRTEVELLGLFGIILMPMLI